jgi:hypothetical protein
MGMRSGRAADRASRKREAEVSVQRAVGVEGGPTGYRLVVEGQIGPDWEAWFGALSVVAADGLTTIEVSVADQSELHGLLRRAHDLHLPIVSLTRLDEG